MKDLLYEKQISSLRGTTYYWTNDINSEQTMVFLPGLTADHSLFEPQIKAFYNKYRIIVWDCPCHGKSRPYAEFTYSNVTEELNSILRAEGIDKAVFIGQSVGGMIAQYYIDLYPETAVGFISVDSVPFGDYYSKSDMFWLKQLEWMCKLFPDKVLRRTIAKMCGASRKARDRMLDILSAYPKKELCHLMYIGEAAFIPENKDMTIPCKSVLLLGGKDAVGKVASYNRKWAEKTGFPLYIIENAAHNANDDAPEQVNSIIAEFMIVQETNRINKDND